MKVKFDGTDSKTANDESAPKRLRHAKKLREAFGDEIRILENVRGSSVLPGVPAYVRRQKQS